MFLPGKTTSGHYQIELACNACHTPSMGVDEKSCIRCHGAELTAANDSHPKSKFTDPRNADLLHSINAANCVTCHREHIPEQTGAMGVTVPSDYCYHCHQSTVLERPSHRNLAFDSCATAGCHNFHDNTALYEDFLARHLLDPDLLPSPKVAQRILLKPASGDHGRSSTGSGGGGEKALSAAQQNAPAEVRVEPELVSDWAATLHARAGVNCQDCHSIHDPATNTRRWSDRLDHHACERCHKEEANGFLAGRHGMRLAQNLSPMQPSMARLPMQPGSGHQTLSCVSCHGAHRFDTRRAAAEACLKCHADDHSLAFNTSPHGLLWKEVESGDRPDGTGVSCATCHLPRTADSSRELTGIRVEHNQNLNLRPNEKMLRGVCLSCHGLGFSIDALADPALVRNNFKGHPSLHLESLDWVRQRLASSEPSSTSVTNRN